MTCLARVFLVVLMVSTATAAPPVPPTNVYEQLVRRLDEQSAEIARLQSELDEHKVLLKPSATMTDSSNCVSEQRTRVPLFTEQQLPNDCVDDTDRSVNHVLNFYADYDRGFVIHPFDEDKHPFELKLNGWIQFRHHGFIRDSETWTDNADVTRQIRNRNAFDIERARLTFDGFAVDKRLTYFLQLDGDTDGSHAVDFFDYWWAWQLTDRFKIEMGKRKVPASRQWLLGARRTRFIDRPMANDFFRPDRTVGLFGVGTIGETGHYQVMVGNGYQNANVPNSLSDDLFTYALTNYFDPFGKFGGQIVDYDQSENPLVRIGHSFSYSPQTSNQIGTPLAEGFFLRLSDGTRVTQTDALAAGATVSEFDIWFYGVDFAFKYQGWSLNAELFLRWVENLRADAPLPIQSLFQHGYYVEAGKFLIPKRLDVNARYSQVDGEFGSGSEYSAGVNWYPLAKPWMKISLDVTSLNDSPLQNTTSDILVGDDGTLLRTQFQAEF